MRIPTSVRLLSASLVAAAATAQCELVWNGGGAYPGPSTSAFCATTWDPDGPGPLPVHAVLGGGFRAAGSVATGYVAAWNPMSSQWRGFGPGLTEFAGGRVNALVVTNLGELVAGGNLRIGTSLANEGVAMWNGAAWSPLRGATGLSLLRVNAMCRATSGDLFACATWYDASNIPRNGVARWNGTAWAIVGTGFFFDGISPGVLASICEMPNGDIVVAGRFTNASGVPVSSVARWNGSAWSDIGSGLAASPRVVNSLAVMPNGNLLAGGDFLTALGSAADGVATFDGTTWTQLGAGLVAPTGVVVLSVEVLPSGDVIACGGFVSSGGAPTFAAARWNGTSWAQVGTGIDVAVGQGCYDSVLLPDGRSLVVGSFASAGGVPTPNAALWNGTTWSPMPTGGGTAGLDGSNVFAIVAEPNGSVVVGGNFTTAGGVSMPRIARWDGITFSPLGSGANNTVSGLARLPNGDIVASGSFTQIGGIVASGIARWDGVAWSSMAATGGGELFVSRAGELYVSSASGPMRWNGTGMVVAGSGWPGAVVLTMGETPAGELLASGLVFNGSTPPTCHVVRLSGGVWVPFGTPMPSAVYAILSSATDVFVGGAFTVAAGGPADYLARYSNGTWAPVGSGFGGPVTELTWAPDGDLVAAGSFPSVGGAPAGRIARFDGATWSAMGQGFDNTVNALSSTGDAVFAGGAFTTAGPAVAFRAAKIRTPCPASATPFGAGCIGVGSQMVLSASQSPYLGATYRSSSTGFGPNTFGLWEIGTAQIAVPVSSILPQGGPGCTQWSLLDVAADLVFPIGGVASGSIFVPGSPALVGVVVYNQMALIQVDPLTGSISNIATSNGLAMTVGAF